MNLSRKNGDMMKSDFATVKQDASLKEAFEAVRANLEAPPHSPGLVVLNKAGGYAGILTVDDLMSELNRLYSEACDRPGSKDWADTFFNRCEIAGMEKVSNIMSGKDLKVSATDTFDRSCEMILSKKLHLLPVVDASSKVVGIITRRQVLAELAPKMFK
jgi:CBS-domain-containing membrane protein